MSPYKSANRHHNHTKTKLCEKITYDPFIGYIIQQHINVIRLLTGKYKCLIVLRTPGNVVLWEVCFVGLDFEVYCRNNSFHKIKKHVSLTKRKNLHRFLPVINIDQQNLGLEDCRHAAHRFFPLTALIG